MATNEAERRRWNDPYWASVWPHREQVTSSVTGYLLEHLQPAEGERILDVGSGGGVATLAIGPRAGSGAVVGADISAPLVDLARQRARERGLDNVSFVVADVQHDAVPGAPFDAVTSQFGVMFFDEPGRAFANLRAQTAPTGRIVFACWQELERNPWFAGPALAPFVPPPPPPAPGKSPTGPFSLGDARATTALLETSGWNRVERHPYELVVTVDRDAIIDQGQLQFQGIPEAVREEAWEALQAALEPLKDPDGRYRLPLAFQIFTASPA